MYVVGRATGPQSMGLMGLVPLGQVETTIACPEGETPVCSVSFMDKLNVAVMYTALGTIVVIAAGLTYGYVLSKDKKRIEKAVDKRERDIYKSRAIADKWDLRGGRD